MSAADFEQQQRSALLNCPACGIHEIAETLHAPYESIGDFKREQHAARTALQHS